MLLVLDDGQVEFADVIHVKTPGLGSIGNTIEALLLARVTLSLRTPRGRTQCCRTPRESPQCAHRTPAPAP